MMDVWFILLVGGLIFFGLLVLLLALYSRGYMQRLPMWTGLGYGKDSQLGFKVYEKVQIADETQEAQTKKHTEIHELQPGKTLWDWLQLLLVPVVLADDANLQHADLGVYRHSINYTTLFCGQRDNAKLTPANLSDAVLTRANLSQAILAQANLTDADLTQANLTGADFTQANLSHAMVSSQQLATAKSLAGAIMPDGTGHP